MATYIVLGNFTDQGIRNCKDTVKRADAAKEAAQKFGVTMKDIVWTQGQYDLVATFEAPDEQSVTAFALAVGMAGNIHTQTMRAFTRSEMTAILARLG